jgi:hypothetical protein
MIAESPSMARTVAQYQGTTGPAITGLEFTVPPAPVSTAAGTPGAFAGA